jgi:hypothetical protein
LFQDDLLSVSVSRLRASRAVTSDMKSIVVIFGDGGDPLRREVKLWHMAFPSGGSWSYFLCPSCSRRCRTLKVLNGRVVCRRCCLREGVGYRISSGTVVERDAARMVRIARLRAMLYGEPARLRPRKGRTMDRRRELTISLRRAMIVLRQDLLTRRSAGLKLH